MQPWLLNKYVLILFYLIASNGILNISYGSKAIFKSGKQKKKKDVCDSFESWRTLQRHLSFCHFFTCFSMMDWWRWLRKKPKPAFKYINPKCFSLYNCRWWGYNLNYEMCWLLRNLFSVDLFKGIQRVIKL